MGQEAGYSLTLQLIFYRSDCTTVSCAVTQKYQAPSLVVVAPHVSHLLVGQNHRLLTSAIDQSGRGFEQVYVFDRPVVPAPFP